MLSTKEETRGRENASGLCKKQEGAGIYRRTAIEDRKGAEYIERGRHQKKIK